MNRTINATVLGSGVWGTVISGLLAKKGHRVNSWEYNKETAEFLKTKRTHPVMPYYRLPDNVTVHTDLKEALADTHLLVFAVASAHLRDVAGQVNGFLPKNIKLPAVAVSKGIETKTFKTVCTIIEEEIHACRGRTMMMSGPSFAVETAKDCPTKVVLAGQDYILLKHTADMIQGGPLKLELSNDRLGTELGGSLKNVYAVGSGIIDGLSNGAKNSEAAFLIESADELRKIIIAMGGRPETAWGLSGMGDLLLTATSAKSRNYTFGQYIGRGMTSREAKEKIQTVVEGFEALENAHELCKYHKIDAPVIDSIWRIVYKDHKPQSVLEAAGFYLGE